MDSLLLYSALAVNALSGLLIITGIVFIRLGWKVRHRKVMITACILALFFVGLYVTRSSMFPPNRYGTEYRTLFLVVLWTHTVLAVVNFPMAGYTVYLALKERFDRHKRLAPYTAGVWIYVAASGWMVYFLNA